MKTCAKCEETKPLSEYYQRSANADRVLSTCKTCRSAYKSARYAALKASGPLVDVTHKVCARCCVDKPAAEFYVNHSKTDGLRSNCSLCTREQQLLSRYGLTIADYDAMFDAQGGCCAICAVAEVDAAMGRFHVDHCHTSGEVRGLLCHNCNTGLGKFKDDINALAAAITYLES
jgi:hypothetical protein